MKPFYKIAICFCLLVLASCSTLEKTKEHTQTETKKTTHIIKKDTVLVTEKDSSFYKAWIECVNNKPVIKLPDTVLVEPRNKTEILPLPRKGKFLKPPSVKLKGNVLDVSCEAEAQKLFFSWKEKFIQEQTTKTKTIVLPPVRVPRELTWWQKLWITLGKISTFSVLIWIAIKKIPWRSLFKLLKLLP